MANASRYENWLEPFRVEIEKLDVHSLLPILLKKRIILTSEWKQLVTNNKANKTPAEIVYSILLRRGSDCLTQFISALREDGHEKHKKLARILARERNKYNYPEPRPPPEPPPCAKKRCLNMHRTCTESSRNNCNHWKETGYKGVVTDLSEVVTTTGHHLGCGRFGSVYRVEYRGIICAAKKIHSFMFEDMGSEERQKLETNFIEECCYSGKLIHPNIVECHGIFYPTQHSFPQIVMELMDVNLSMHIKNSNMSLPEKISILHDIVLALHFLHTKNPPVSHGDLHSNNVLLKFTGNEMLPIAKLANFGMAKMMQAYSKNVNIQPTKALKFEELLIDDLKYSTAEDVHSLACITLQLFSQKPIETEHRQLYLDMITGEAAVMRPVIDACLHNKPECRPSVSAVLTEISKIIKTNPAVTKSINEGLRRNIGALFFEAKTFVDSLGSHHQINAPKAINQKGEVGVRYAKIVFSGPAATGKSSFFRLLMKKNTNYFVSVKNTDVTSEVHDQNTRWLEMDDNSLTSHLREILFSCDISYFPSASNEIKLLHNQLPQLANNSLVQGSIKSGTTYQCCEEMLNIITLLDTGGQPEYISLLPAMNIHPMVSFVVYDLSKYFEDQVLVEYGEHEKQPLYFEYLDLIKGTIPDKISQSYLCCVGTNASKVNPDTIRYIDNQLTAMVDKLKCKDAVWKNINGGVLFPVDNTTKEDLIVNYIQDKINKVVVDNYICELPVSWMLFELEIRRMCTNSSKAYISFIDCCSIARQTNLISNIQEVRNVLTYFHSRGVLLYYSDVPGLCEYVITEHQWLFNKIESIVCFTSSNKFSDFKYNGILTKELIRAFDWKEEVKDEYCIALLVAMKLIAPIQREDGDGEDYFIPYILPTYTFQPNFDILSQHGYLQGEPLLIQFESNFLPRGFFCCLVVQMLQQLPKGWGHLFTQSKSYNNLITFRLPNEYSLCLMDRLSYLEVQIRHHEKKHHLQFPIHVQVQKTLDNALKVVCKQLTFDYGRLQYGFNCQCGEYDNDGEHIAVLQRVVPPFVSDYAWCKCKDAVTMKLEFKHKVWLEDNETPLVVAVEGALENNFNNGDVMKILVENGAEIDVKDGITFTN